MSDESPTKGGPPLSLLITHHSSLCRDSPPALGEPEELQADLHKIDDAGPGILPGRLAPAVPQRLGEGRIRFQVRRRRRHLPRVVRLDYDGILERFGVFLSGRAREGDSPTGHHLEAYQADPEGYLVKSKIVAKDALLADRRPRTEWKFDDLAPAVTEMKAGRSFGNLKTAAVPF